MSQLTTLANYDGVRDSQSLELFGVRFRSHPGTQVDYSEPVAVVGCGRRGGSVFVKQGDVVERWHRANATV